MQECKISSHVRYHLTVYNSARFNILPRRKWKRGYPKPYHL